jgi:hypothetical protein
LFKLGGSFFEDLVRKFNEDNEDTGPYWTLRDAVKLSANLGFLRRCPSVTTASNNSTPAYRQRLVARFEVHPAAA